MFWDSVHDLVRIAVMAPLAYAALVIFLRISGKRMLSKMNAFDLVVTIAFGSTLATILLSKDVSLAEGLIALGLLLALQYGVAWSAARSRRISRILKSEPKLLFCNGAFIREALRAENVSEEAIHAGIRQQGYATFEQVYAVVLEADGSLSVLSPPSSPGTDTLETVRGYSHPPVDPERR